MTDLLLHVPLAVGTVRCGHAHHQLVWENGELRAPAHPDPEAELALVALGGEPCRCVELLGYWRACARDPRALILGPRERAAPRDDPMAFLRNRSNRAGAVPLSTGRRRRDLPAEDPLMAVLQISHGLSRRLVATVAAALIEQGDPAQSALLQAALYGRVLAGLTRWLGTKPELQLQVAEASAHCELARTGEHSYSAEMPLRWLTDVWAPELAHAEDGQFTLSASPIPAGGLELCTVDHDLSVTARTYPRRDRDRG